MAGQRTPVLDAGRPHVAGDYVLSTSPSWGTTPSVSAVAATDRGGEVEVTAGSGTPGANPTVKLTFRDGVFNKTPNVVVSRGGTAGIWAVTAADKESVTITFVGTPTASTAYKFRFAVLDAA